MQDSRPRQVRQEAHQPALAVDRVTRNCPREEPYGPTAQLGRSSFSIPANPAEGCGRGSGAEFGRFCSIAMGSASELDYHLLLAHDLGMIEPKPYGPVSGQVEEVTRTLTGLLRKLNAAG
jgi:four helix bundle protein